MMVDYDYHVNTGDLTRVDGGSDARDDETLCHDPAQPHIHGHNLCQVNLRTRRHHKSSRIRHKTKLRLQAQHQTEGAAKQQMNHE